jgi:serine/threonine protein kinase
VTNTSQVFQCPGDPKVYLRVKGECFCYDPSSKPLGEGAMGVVFLGYNCNSNQRIAIKCVRAAYANEPLIRQRARQEASLSFSHPNIVRMIGMCEQNPDSGPIFILSNYVSGLTLDEHVRTQLGNLAPEDRVEKISNEICCVLDALTYLHSRGVVHRDIKPSNIMLEDGSVVKLMDLGIARMNGGNKYSSYGFIGTPQYAAPEQILRDVSNTEINATTDIYALGITYYELLTGHNPMNSNIDSETLSNQIAKKLPYDKAIPRRLFRVISKATEKHPDKRYQSAEEFKQAIQSAIRQPQPFSLADWIADHKVLSAVIGIVVLLGLLITILSLLK